MAPTKTQTVHSKIYWLFIVIAVILGLPGTIGIYLWISNHTTHSVRIPVYLLALPIIILIWAAGAIDCLEALPKGEPKTALVAFAHLMVDRLA